MKKISKIVVVSHFASLRSEICDIITGETEYSAEGKSFDQVKLMARDASVTDVVFVIDLDSFSDMEKLDFKSFVSGSKMSGMIVIFGSKDISAVLASPLKESGNYFIPKPTGHLKTSERFMRNLNIALTKSSGSGITVKAPEPAPMLSAVPTPKDTGLSYSKTPADSGNAHRRVSIVKSDEPSFLAHPDQLHVKTHLRCRLSAGGKIADDNLIVAIASSTGGPKALQDFIPMLPKGLAAPVILTQHMPAGFTRSMAERLDEISKISVKEAEEGDILRAGMVYIAPGGKHLTVKQSREGHVVALSDEAPVGGLKPCADIMYRSLQFCKYSSVLCTVLTGMGADGTRGIVRLGEKKNIYVISQDEASCVVYGMPKSIAEAGYSDEVLPLLSIAKSIQQKVGVK